MSALQTAGAHAQEIEHPVQQVEHGAADSYGSNRNGLADAACDCNVDQTKHPAW